MEYYFRTRRCGIACNCWAETTESAPTVAAPSARRRANALQGDIYSRQFCEHNCLFYFAKDLFHKGQKRAHTHRHAVLAFRAHFNFFLDTFQQL